MSTHHHLTTATQSTSDTMEERATPYNRPRVQPGAYIERSAPVDPTATLIATGGSLLLNANDRAALKEWFVECFKNQFDVKLNYKATWFGDWFCKEFYPPMRDTINHNFNKAFDTIRKNEEEVVKLRKEVDQIQRAFKHQNKKLGKAKQGDAQDEDDFMEQCISNLEDQGVDDAENVCAALWEEQEEMRTIEQQRTSRVSQTTLPDRHWLLQTYVWQDYDMFPNFPALKDFLAFWEKSLEGPLFAVTVAHSKLIKPAELHAVDGVFRLH